QSFIHLPFIILLYFLPSLSLRVLTPPSHYIYIYIKFTTYSLTPLPYKQTYLSIFYYTQILRAMKAGFATLCLLLIISSVFQLPTVAAGDGESSWCDSKCGVRCSKAGVKDRCLKYCGICCEKCNCVPSGTYGNKDECPCYRDMMNSKGKPKCP
ncbi:unnamed protein product, partial [Linum grandiflorum]